MERKEVDRLKVSPMMKQYLDIKDNYENIILFFRLGDFYEMFFEDAITVSHELELTLTGKNAGLDERIPMCGVPFHAGDVYIDKLIEKGYRVAVCEQTSDPKAKGIVKREVLEIVSRGTSMNTNTINETDSNFIGSIISTPDSYIISYADVTTGKMFVTSVINSKDVLVREILNIGLKEVVVLSGFDKWIINKLRQEFNICVYISDILEEISEYSNLYSNITDVRFIEGIKHLLCYLNYNSKRSLTHMQMVEVRNLNKYMHMDYNTKKNLELVSNIRLNTKEYSLMWLLDKTKTAMGARCLRNYIQYPLVEKEKIEYRYDIVSKLLFEFIKREELRDYLYEVYDIERLCGKISYGNANAKDLLQLKNSIKVFPGINSILSDIGYSSKLFTLEELCDLLESSIDENAPITIKEGSIIKEGYSKELDELKKIRLGGKDFIASLEAEEKEKTGIKNLKVGYNKVFGYYIEIPKGSIGLVKEEFGYERKQTIATGERYITPVLKEKEALILGAEEKIINMEYELFIDIRDKVKTYIRELQENSKIIADIDVLSTFAVVSEENNYVRPSLNLGTSVNIIGARHPVVERVLDSTFIDNDIIMNDDTSILLITGPNMAGKSTYMRMMAIISIMAQIGCFVPCKSASLPIFDGIYTRIGASDDLVNGESTFMVEMSEANNAISNATKNSLILFDELGRGTATYDGMALAQSILEYIHNEIGCKTIFSTHYHELTSLETSLTHLKNVHVSAEENDGDIIFLHKIKEGAVDKSYGIYVAKLANLPSKVINRAGVILNHYESSPTSNITSERVVEKVIHEKSEVEEELKNTDIMSLTPIDALNLLYKLKEKIKK